RDARRVAARGVQGTPPAPAVRRVRLPAHRPPSPPRPRADPPATGEVVERVEREDQLRLAAMPPDELLELIVARLALEPPLDRKTEHCNRRGGGLGIDDADPVAELGRRKARTLDRAGEGAGDVERVDPLV